MISRTPSPVTRTALPIHAPVTAPSDTSRIAAVTTTAHSVSNDTTPATSPWPKATQASSATKLDRKWLAANVSTEELVTAPDGREITKIKLEGPLPRPEEGLGASRWAMSPESKSANQTEVND
jgi:hypothetical protein